MFRKITKTSHQIIFLFYKWFVFLTLFVTFWPNCQQVKDRLPGPITWHLKVTYILKVKKYCSFFCSLI